MQSQRVLSAVKLCALVALVAGLVAGAGPAGPELVEGAFPGANGKIVFVRDPGDDIYLMNPDGSGLVRLTDTPADVAEEAFPTWSADGSRIAFRKGPEGGTGDIYVMNADGSGVTRLTNHPADDTDPSWSPDGSRLVFASTRDDPDPPCYLGEPCNFEIYVMNADGSGQTNLTNNPALDGAPAWSPDGMEIAFHSDRDGNAEVYVMNADGSGQTNLTNHAANDGLAAWSPNGSQVVFVSTRDDADPSCFVPPACNFEIYAMNADGSGQTRLTDDPGADWDPAWSPDGSKIAFSSDRTGDHEIYVMNADGSGLTRLTNYPGDFDAMPDWQPLSCAEDGPSRVVPPRFTPAFLHCRQHR